MQALVPAGQVGANGQIFLDANVANPSAVSTALVPAAPGMGTVATTAIRLPNGTIINVATQDVPNLMMAYQQMVSQQQQQQVVNLAGGTAQSPYVPNTTIGTFAKAGKAVSELFTSLSLSRLIDRANTARKDAELAKSMLLSSIAAGNFDVNAFTDYMNANDRRNDAQDDVNSAIALQAYVNAGGDAAELYERLRSGGSSGSGLDGGLGVALGVGGGLLLSNLLIRPSSSSGQG